MATITGTSGRDTLSGTPDADQIWGLGGNDTIYGSAGSDRLDGGDGSDTVNYSRLGGSVQLQLDTGWVGKSEGGADTIVSIGNAVGTRFGDSMWGNGNENILQGGAGDDRLYGGAGNDTLDGGDGSDSVDYGGSPAGVTVDLAAGTASDGHGGADRIVSVGLATGSSFADTVYGNGNANTLSGTEGNDQLYGRAGDDTLLGGQGDDLLDGGDGSDTVSYFWDPAGVTVDLAAGTATDGWGGHDTIISSGLVTGTPDHQDVLMGNNNENTINGIGGGDILTGRGGADTFVLNSWDWWGSTITDFQHGLDELSVSLRSTPISGGTPLGTLGSSHFTTGSPATDQWTFIYDQSSGVVSFDLDGSGPDSALTVVTLSNHPTLGASDFTLA